MKIDVIYIASIIKDKREFQRSINIHFCFEKFPSRINLFMKHLNFLLPYMYLQKDTHQRQQTTLVLAKLYLIITCVHSPLIASQLIVNIEDCLYLGGTLSVDLLLLVKVNSCFKKDR